MSLGYVLGPLPSRQFGYAGPLLGAAVAVIVTLSIPVSLPDVRNPRLRQAADAGRQADVAA